MGLLICSGFSRGLEGRIIQRVEELRDEKCRQDRLHAIKTEPFCSFVRYDETDAARKF